mmetsp:Transcript_4915/g.12245  ORF Transcript_4915/g.12245 Transcript_4915/m.12245 type:complete len:255 (-) Transcript_4915:131-895(-)
MSTTTGLFLLLVLLFVILVAPVTRRRAPCLRLLPESNAVLLPFFPFRLSQLQRDAGHLGDELFFSCDHTERRQALRCVGEKRKLHLQCGLGRLRLVHRGHNLLARLGHDLSDQVQRRTLSVAIPHLPAEKVVGFALQHQVEEWVRRERRLEEHLPAFLLHQVHRPGDFRPLHLARVGVLVQNLQLHEAAKHVVGIIHDLLNGLALLVERLALGGSSIGLRHFGAASMLGEKIKVLGMMLEVKKKIWISTLIDCR